MNNHEMEEVIRIIATSMGEQYYALYYIFLDTKRYICFQEKIKGKLSHMEEQGDYVTTWEQYIDSNIEEPTRDALRKFGDINTIDERIGNKNMISLDYFRQDVGWTRGKFIAGKRDDSGKMQTVIFVVSDINDEKEMLQRNQLVELETLQDPLTKLWNRKAFEKIVKKESESKKPLAVLMIDLDNFKTINDNYGHEVGDEVLVKAAESMKNLSRSDDDVFRLGGDEFVIILRNCTDEAWKTLCEKHQHMHIDLEDKIENIALTFSAGVVFSRNGYSEDLYQLADEMLYEVKRRGRAGCAMLDKESGKKRYWRDDRISYKAQNILAFNNTGVYRIEYPLDAKTEPRLFCGDMTRELFAFPEHASPEECYEIWVSNIEPSYRKIISEIRQNVKLGEQVECTYQWNHPVYGKIFIRTGGIAEVKDRIQSFHGYHHSMKNTKILKLKDDTQLMFDAMNHIYFCSYYIDIKNDSFSILKNAPGEKHLEVQENKATDAIHQFLTTLVNENDYKKMSEFMDFSTLQERMKNEEHLDCEYLSKTEKGWCRASLFSVKRDAAQRVTHVLFVVTSLDENKAKEAKRLSEDRRDIENLYNNIPGGIAMFEWDGVTLKKIYVSEFLKKENGYIINSEKEENQDILFNKVHPYDLEDYQKAVENALKTEGEFHYEFRRWSEENKCYLWTHIDARGNRQPDGNLLIYAILTTHDVTYQMEGICIYKERLRNLLSVKENVMNMCLLNVTRDTCDGINLSKETKPLVEKENSINTIISQGAARIVDKGVQQEYYNMFCRENLLKHAAEGNMHVQMEYWLEIEKNHYEWIISNVDLVKNPINEEIMGVAYNQIAREKKLKEALFGMTLKQDYLFAVMIIVDTDEYYMYDVASGKFGKREYDFWNAIYKDTEINCSPEVSEVIKKKIYKENVLKNLETMPEYKFAYNSFYMGKNCRVEVRFSYADENHSMLLVSMRNVTDDDLLKQFKYDSEHDSLTGLYNRKTVFRKSRELIEKYPDEKYAIVHVDLRHFRLYNTFFGEEAGDQLLCEVAEQLRRMAPNNNRWVYGRIDADVFYACFPYDEERYQKHVAMANWQLRNYRKDFLVQVAIGMYFVTDSSMPIDAMFARATLAAKSLKTGNTCDTLVFDKQFEEKLIEDQQIINDMQRAIDEEQFQVYLQPKYSLRTNKPVGAEALVRWIHPTKGMISPGEFIPLFEGNGFITKLDHYMWEHVCQLLRKWKDEGKPLFPISVNISRVSMYSIVTVEYLKKLVVKYDIEPKYIELELTESAYMDEPEELKKLLKMLRAEGFTILLDDFGSGYSSLNTLRELQVDVLKLDMRFLSLESNDIQGGIVLSSIVRMSKLLKLRVIAEGVETQEQADFLKGIGCGFVQGFLFARPMPVADYEKILMNCEEPLIHVNQPMIEHIGKIIAETGTVTYAMGTVLPMPLAYLEYSNGEFTFVRVNARFYEEFHLEEELEAAAYIFKTHLTEDSYAQFVQTMEKSSKTDKVSQVQIVWNLMDGLQKKYMCSLAYEGHIGDTIGIVITFTDITNISS